MNLSHWGRAWLSNQATVEEEKAWLSQVKCWQEKGEFKEEQIQRRLLMASLIFLFIMSINGVLFVELLKPSVSEAAKALMIVFMIASSRLCLNLRKEWVGHRVKSGRIKQFYRKSLTEALEGKEVSRLKREMAELVSRGIDISKIEAKIKEDGYYKKGLESVVEEVKKTTVSEDAAGWKAAWRSVQGVMLKHL